VKEVTEWVHGVKNDDKVSEGAAKFEAAAIEAGTSKGLAFPLTKTAAAVNMQKLKAPIEEKE